MVPQNSMLSRLVRRLRPSPERFAAAAALYDPALMLALRAHAPREDRGAAR
jgi:hypothetical protein